MGDGKRLLFSVEIGIDLFFMAVENYFFLVYGSKLTPFFVSGHRNRLDIRVGIEIDLVLVWVSKLTSFLCGGSKLSFVFVCGPIIIWF